MPFSLQWFCAPEVITFWASKLRTHGALVAGALFGAGWWFWVDAASITHVPFDRYIPGIIATLALIMINVGRREDGYDPLDEHSYCRLQLWLFMSYLVSFGAIIGSVWVLLKYYALNSELSGVEVWPGVAGLFQVTFILGSGLVLFVARSQGDDSYAGMGYTGF